MTAYPDLPWSRINDCLLEVGSVHNISEFGLRALLCLADLVPFDVNGVYAVNDATGRMCTRATSAEASKWVELYNNYYWKTQPNLPTLKTMIFNWHDLRHTEYVTDFLNPQEIGFSASIYHLESIDNFTGGFVLHRSKTSSCFSEQERLILEVIQPHLVNFHQINTLLATYDVQRFPDATTLASDYKCLTKREAEIAALICCKFQTSMIATRLLISSLTVYRHVANIFTKFNVFNREELVEKILGDYYRGKDSA